MLLYNKYDRQAEQLALLAEYHAQLERMAAVRVVETLTDDEIQEEYRDYSEWQLDLEFIRMGGN
jgi:hypothetical protein